jgi:hypothetical protein
MSSSPTSTSVGAEIRAISSSEMFGSRRRHRQRRCIGPSPASCGVWHYAGDLRARSPEAPRGQGPTRGAGRTGADAGICSQVIKPARRPPDPCEQGGCHSPHPSGATLGWSSLLPLTVRRGRQRPRYEHGCGGLRGRKAGYCPTRRKVTPDAAQTKSTAGRRTIGLPAQLVARLRTHLDEQTREREPAGNLWHDGGRVFATPTGEPLNLNTDHHQWKELLRVAGLRDGRVARCPAHCRHGALDARRAERTVVGGLLWEGGAGGGVGRGPRRCQLRLDLRLTRAGAGR